MNETLILKVAAAHGLTLTKRITTGTERSGFATFELAGTSDAVWSAWDDLKEHGRGRSFDGIDCVNNPDHPDHGKPFVRLDSVYFDTQT
jgi:hypothetical protein